VVPSIGLVAAGDVVYNGVHQYILEGGNGGLREWLRALDQVESLQPRFVVVGHKNRDLPDDPGAIDQNRQYLRDVIRLLDDKPTARTSSTRWSPATPTGSTGAPSGTAPSGCSGRDSTPNAD
jgi:glyoxylase-like metal-dependent hydrolase (beta-lactamase superfamily II)